MCWEMVVWVVSPASFVMHGDVASEDVVALDIYVCHWPRRSRCRGHSMITNHPSLSMITYAVLLHLILGPLTLATRCCWSWVGRCHNPKTLGVESTQCSPDL